MEYMFISIGCVGLAIIGKLFWHLMTDDDKRFELTEVSSDFDYVRIPLANCTHQNVGQYDGECECGERVEIGGSE